MSRVPTQQLRVMVADSNQMQSQLLVGAIRRRPEFQVFPCPMEIDSILETVAYAPIDVAILNATRDHGIHDLATVRRLHVAHPAMAKILLLASYDRELVVNAFRSGVKGIFCFSESPFRLLCRCVRSVHRGEIWANAAQGRYLVEARN